MYLLITGDAGLSVADKLIVVWAFTLNAKQANVTDRKKIFDFIFVFCIVILFEN